MTQPADLRPALEPDPEALAVLSHALLQLQYDDALMALRPDYFTSPFPHVEMVQKLLPGLPENLALAIRLFAFGEPVASTALETLLGRELVEAGLVSGLLQYDDQTDQFHTGGYTLISRLGLYFVVSANPYYATATADNADVYMGPDSYTLINALAARAHQLPTSGDALDLCCGSGIAGMSTLPWRPGLQWTGIDLSPGTVATANFNAMLNGYDQSYRAVQSNLFEAVSGRTFDLVVANPPFIPVPDGISYPIYGAGGSDGRLVLAPLLRALPKHLTPSGRAIIYGEGLSTEGRLLIEPDMDVLRDQGWDVRVTIFSEVTIERALYTLGHMLARMKPPRLPEIVHWRDLFRQLHVDRYVKFIIDVQRGSGECSVSRVCPDPEKLRSSAVNSPKREESQA